MLTEKAGVTKMQVLKKTYKFDIVQILKTN